MDRRELLKQVAFIMGGAISAPAIVGVLSGCSPKHDATSQLTWKPQFLNEAQAAVVTAVADIIIPRTNTPGASDVGVPAFIDLMLKDVYPTEDQQRFLSGLQEIDDEASKTKGKTFVALDAKDQEALVRKHHDAAMNSEREARATSKPHLKRPFVLMTKELTMLGYFTSQAGATEVLQYSAVPGAFHGCIPIKDAGNGKTWAQDMSMEF
jgi:gluconate 2-dehydrogenase gamma chain